MADNEERLDLRQVLELARRRGQTPVTLTPRCDWQLVERLCLRALEMEEVLRTLHVLDTHISICAGCKASGGFRYLCNDHAMAQRKGAYLVHEVLEKTW